MFLGSLVPFGLLKPNPHRPSRCLQWCCFMLLPLHCTFAQPWGHSCPPCVAWSCDCMKPYEMEESAALVELETMKNLPTLSPCAFSYYAQSIRMETAPQHPPALSFPWGSLLQGGSTIFCCYNAVENGTLNCFPQQNANGWPRVKCKGFHPRLPKLLIEVFSPKQDHQKQL